MMRSENNERTTWTGVCVTPEFENYKGGIFKDASGCTSIDHEISIAGYGSEGGVDYWCAFFFTFFCARAQL